MSSSKAQRRIDAALLRIRAARVGAETTRQYGTIQFLDELEAVLAEPSPVIRPARRYGRVYLVGPESKVYHLSEHCPALDAQVRYWPVKRGKLLPDGSIEAMGGLHHYRGRRPCKRCSAE